MLFIRFIHIRPATVGQAYVRFISASLTSKRSYMYRKNNDTQKIGPEGGRIILNLICVDFILPF